LVNLTDYVDTGLFLDHRITRNMFRSEAKQKRILNLFGYTGAFTVYAADGGASSIVHVDASKTYIEWAQKNMSINQFHDSRYSFQVEDVPSFLSDLPERPMFDLAIVDPPTFSNSKKSEQVWDVQKHHCELLSQVKKRMAPQGVLYFSTNFKQFKLDEINLPPFTVIREISRQTVPVDFRNKRIHRCWRFVV
jgi:23S rRNA G2069 N7-methylase RlmK/C1962 C5-methylase RlmI